MLPEVKPSSGVYGYTKDCLIGDGIAIAGQPGISYCIVRAVLFSPGDVKTPMAPVVSC